MTYEIKEHAGSVCGVPGRFANAHAWRYAPRELWSTQTWKSDARSIDGFGEPAMICAEIRFDDDCRNGHNSFAITADVFNPKKYGDDAFIMCGCCHDEVARAFPELAPLIRWHSVSTDSPMHYIANTVYLAGDLDHNGRAAGAPERYAHGIRFGGSPITHTVKEDFWQFLKSRMNSGEFILQKVDYRKRQSSDYDFAPKYTFVGFSDETWHSCPFDSEQSAREWIDALCLPGVEFMQIPVAWSKGKERQLDAARTAANWPEATDEQLTLPRDELKALLEARLPDLQARMRAAITGAGFAWSPSEVNP